MSFTINTSPWPLRVTLPGVGELAPTDDITPKEAVHITAMLACGIAGAHVDHAAYVAEHGLQRHFRPAEGKSESQK